MLRAHRLDVQHAAEAAHRLLERIRRARGRSARWLRRRGSASAPNASRTSRNDLRRGGGDVVARARVDADVVALLVHLDPRAIELPFDRGRRRRCATSHPRCRRRAARASVRAAGTARSCTAPDPRRPPRSRCAATAAMPPPAIAARRTHGARRPPLPQRRRRSSALRARPGAARPTAGARGNPPRRRSLARRARATT